MNKNHLGGGFVKTQIVWLHQENVQFSSLGLGPRICITHKLPGDDGAGLGTIPKANDLS